MDFANNWKNQVQHVFARYSVLIIAFPSEPFETSTPGMHRPTELNSLSFSSVKDTNKVSDNP